MLRRMGKSQSRVLPLVVLAAGLLASCQHNDPAAMPATTPRPDPAVPAGAMRLAVPAVRAETAKFGAHTARLSLQRLQGTLPPLPHGQGEVSWFPRAMRGNGTQLELTVVTCRPQHSAQLLETPRFVLLRVLGGPENDPGFCGGYATTVRLSEPLGTRALYTAQSTALRPPQLHAVPRS